MKKLKNLLSIVLLMFYWGCNSNTSSDSNNKTDNNKLDSISAENELAVSSNTETGSTNKKNGNGPLLEVDYRIEELLNKTRKFQVPLKYSFEKENNLSSIRDSDPLSDEVLSLFEVKRFDKRIDDFNGIVWLSCQLDISAKYRTLIFSITDDSSFGENILVNYTNSFEFIACKQISFEDYVEGYYSINSMITKNRITNYYQSSFDYGSKADTTFFEIDNQGRIDSLINRKDILPN